MQRALGHWEEAVADLGRAIELDPRDVRACNNLALTYCAMRRFPEALATLDRVLAWDPTNGRTLLTKADALMAIGDLKSAEPLLANPNLPANRRARYALFQRNYAAATDILSRDLAIKREQRDAEDILTLAFSQQLAGKLSAASVTYQKAIENFSRELQKVAPGSFAEADTHARLAAAYAGLGKPDSAIAEAQRGMALVPGAEYPDFGPDLEDEMARIYAQLGDAGHAIPMLKRLLQASYGGATFLTSATLRLDPIGMQSATTLVFRTGRRKGALSSNEFCFVCGDGDSHSTLDVRRCAFDVLFANGQMEKRRTFDRCARLDGKPGFERPDLDSRARHSAPPRFCRC